MTILSLRNMAQEVNIDEYKDYKPCADCSTEQWEKTRSEGSSTSNRSNSNRSNSKNSNSNSNHSNSNNPFINGILNDIKNGSRKIVVFCVSIVGTLAGVIIYQKINNEINNIN